MFGKFCTQKWHGFFHTLEDNISLVSTISLDYEYILCFMDITELQLHWNEYWILEAAAITFFFFFETGRRTAFD